MMPIALALLFSLCAGDPPAALRFDFEAAPIGEALPDPWVIPPAIVSLGGRAEIVDVADGGAGHCMKAVAAGSNAPGNVMFDIDAGAWRGRRVRVASRLRASADAAGLMWIRVMRPDDFGFFDNMNDHPAVATAWQTYETIGEVAGDATRILCGVVALRGDVWVDDFTLEVFGEGRDQAPAAITDRGLGNLVALTRLLGYVRHFHPADPALAVDWSRFARQAVREVEPAIDADDLRDRLLALLQPIAPTVQIWTGTAADAPPPSAVPADATQVIGVRHLGLGKTLETDAGDATEDADQLLTPFRSLLLREPLDLAAADRRIAAPGSAVVVELPGGVACRVPISLYADAMGTLPRVAPRARDGELAPFDPADRSSRLAGVMATWNLFQHFHPYRDLAAQSWSEVLPGSLRRAATEAGPVALLRTLEEMIATRRDGQAVVISKSLAPRFALPMRTRWLEGELVVVQVDPTADGQVSVGEAIRAIDGVPMAELWASVEPRVAASNVGFLAFALPSLLTTFRSAGTTTLRLAAADGSERDVALERVAGQDLRLERGRPAAGAELAQGIVYCDLVALAPEALPELLPALAAARGLVLDLRGLPGPAAANVLPHLSDQTLHSTWWDSPVFLQPDQRGVAWERSRWTIEPAAPTFTRNVAFLIDASVLGYGETLAEVIARHQLGDLVGETTAGANGNVNSMDLSADLEVRFTGVRVTSSDGSTYIGAGIAPTHPVPVTRASVRAGRDLQLEAAIELVAERLRGG